MPEEPVITQVASLPVTPGNQTSEHAIAQNTLFWSKIGLILGAAITIIPSVMQAIQPLTPENNKFTMIAGAVVMGLSQIQNLLVALGFIKSRTEVKTAAAVAPTTTVTTNVEAGK